MLTLVSPPYPKAVEGFALRAMPLAINWDIKLFTSMREFERRLRFSGQWVFGELRDHGQPLYATSVGTSMFAIQE